MAWFKRFYDPIILPDGRKLLTLRVSLAGPAYDSNYKRMVFWNRLLPRLNALPGERETQPLPSMEEVREERRLFRRFLAAGHSVQMFGLDVS